MDKFELGGYLCYFLGSILFFAGTGLMLVHRLLSLRS